jgi:hypothetical protein
MCILAAIYARYDEEEPGSSKGAYRKCVGNKRDLSMMVFQPSWISLEEERYVDIIYAVEQGMDGL